jgi:DNA sulfur modification protein DndD
LVVKKNGSLLTDIGPEEWQDFLHDLIPIGVSQLFFFDGEKIGELADGDHDEEHLASAVRGLLGIDLVARLHADLGLFLTRQNRTGDNTSGGDLQRALQSIDIIDEQLSRLNEDVSELSAQRDAEARAADQVRRRFVNEGGELASRRTRLSTERDSLERQLGRLQHELRDLANGSLPFALAPRLTRRFAAVLHEADVFDQNALRPQMIEAFRAALKRWKRTSDPSRSSEWTSGNWKDLDSFITSWALLGAANAPVLDHVMGETRRSMIRLLESVESSVRPRVEHLGNEMIALEKRIAELGDLLTRADRGDTSLLLEELRAAEQRVGSTQATLSAREQDLKRLRAERTALERQKARLLEEQAKSVLKGQRADLAARVSRALAEYERKLLLRKVDKLCDEFVRCFNYLIRKEDFVSSARIDPETFSVTLVAGNGSEIAKHSLSAGEKQIYAVALLWALARTSGRALPMIIDTPLARLDSEHRQNLVERYFPAASHQVILLSTDVEIDSGLRDRLAPHISHTLELSYYLPTGQSLVKESYFGKTSYHDREIRVADAI